MYLRTLGLYQIVSLLRSDSQNIIGVNLLGTYSTSVKTAVLFVISIYIPSPFTSQP